MLRQTIAFLCLVTAAFGASVATPRPLADVLIQTTDKKKINLKQFRGKVVLLVLISTTCDDCIRTVDLLNRMQKDYGPQGFQVVAAGVNDNAPYEVAPFMQRYRPAYPMGYLDRDATIKIAAVPANVRPFVPIAMFIDRKGIVQQQFYGDDPIYKDEEKAFRAIAASLIKFGQPTK